MSNATPVGSSTANETIGQFRDSRPLTVMDVLTNKTFLYCVSLVTFFWLGILGPL